MKILIVDDNDQMRHLLSLTFLQGTEHSLLQAKNGAEALALVREFKPDIAFLDIMMPGDFDGIEVCRFIKQSEEKNCFIVLLSAKSQQADIDRGLAAGANMYLTKPFSPFHLIDVVENLHNTRNKTLIHSIPEQNNVDAPEIYKNIAGFDAERLQVLETMLGSASEVLKAIQKFVSNFANFTFEIKLLSENKDVEKMCIKLHTLKGSASNVGAKKLAHVANDIENALKNNEDASTLFFDFYKELEIVSNAAKNLDVDAPKISDYVEFERDLTELEDCVKHDKMISKSLIQSLEKNVTAQYKNEVDILIKQVKNFDYEAAACSIKQLRDSLN